MMYKSVEAVLLRILYLWALSSPAWCIAALSAPSHNIDGQGVWPRSPQSTPSSAPRSSNNPSNGIATGPNLSTGAAVGIAIAVIIGAVILALIITYNVLRRRRRRRQNNQSNPVSLPESSGLRALDDVPSINPLARMKSSDRQNSKPDARNSGEGGTVEVMTDNRKRSSMSTSDPIANIPREWAAKLPKDQRTIWNDAHESPILR